LPKASRTEHAPAAELAARLPSCESSTPSLEKRLDVSFIGFRIVRFAGFKGGYRFEEVHGASDG
jgi:hypothetical protein